MRKVLEGLVEGQFRVVGQQQDGKYFRPHEEDHHCPDKARERAKQEAEDDREIIKDGIPVNFYVINSQGDIVYSAE